MILVCVVSFSFLFSFFFGKACVWWDVGVGILRLTCSNETRYSDLNR